MLDAQAAWVDFLVDIVRREAVDAVVIAGDVYDRALPGVDVVALLDDALVRLVGAGAEVVVSSGNHDSARRLGFGARLLSAARVHVRTAPGDCGLPVLLNDRYGQVAVYALPYLEPALVAEGMGCRASHADVVRAAMVEVRTDLAGRAAGTRSVVAAHAFVVGGSACDSERDIGVGGVQSVPLEAFDGVDYVALGHLHGRQRLSPTVRYSGSPLAYSFSEHSHTKGAWLVELGPDGVQRVDAVDAPAPRRLAVLRGPLSDVLTDPALARHEAGWCQVTLTDNERPRDAMASVRQRFPHTLELRWEPEAPRGERQPYAARVRGRDDVEVCCDFLEHVRGRRADPAEEALLRAAVEAGRIADVDEAGVAPLRARRGRGAKAPVAARDTSDVPARDAG
jgi:exonuclease SbcD